MANESGDASVKVYDKTGRLVQTLIEGHITTGTHQFLFDATNLKAGLYIVKYSTSSDVSTRKIMKLD